MAAEAAAAVISDLVGEPGDEATVEAVEQQTDTTIPEFEFPNFEADLTGIEDLLDEPDPEPEPEAVYVEADEDEEPVWDDDDEKRKLKSELAKTQKRLQWEQEQRVKASSKGWREEAKRRFPLADVDEIDATSRRALLRKAQEQHSRTETKLKPILDALEALKSQAVAEVKAEARATAAQAWGQPTSAPSAPVVEQAEEDAKLDRKNYRTLHERVLAQVKAGKLQI